LHKVGITIFFATYAERTLLRKRYFTRSTDRCSKDVIITYHNYGDHSSNRDVVEVWMKTSNSGHGDLSDLGIERGG